MYNAFVTVVTDNEDRIKFKLTKGTLSHCYISAIKEYIKSTKVKRHFKVEETFIKRVIDSKLIWSSKNHLQN